ncbi:hypothetical protein BX666DRAFT_1902962 [Dichotomocladium elegans]|nr:hypothetical protein BX666DRAFT_1902962 [Dichotomocladium elegans]
MPHKKAKGPKRIKGESDLPIDPKQLDDTPKAFTRLFQFKEYAEKRKQEKEQQKEQEKKQKKKGAGDAKKQTNLRMFEGEGLREFSHRVEIELNKSIKSAKPLSARKKRNREARKQKEQAKKQRQRELYGGRDFDDLKDDVKFGEVVDAPPVLSKLPKARGKGKETLEAKTKLATEGDQQMEELKASHKRKLQNMSASAKLQLETERERAIELYRAKKAKKMVASGLTPI